MDVVYEVSDGALAEEGYYTVSCDPDYDSAFLDPEDDVPYLPVLKIFTVELRVSNVGTR